jgi:hypothetical protein
MDDKAILFNIFTNVNKWLEYAEKKNTYIFSFYSLIIVFTIILERLTTIATILKIGICIFYGLYIISIAITMLSFFPITKISKKIIENGNDKKLSGADNLIFWGDIYKYNSQEYGKSLSEKYQIDIENSVFLKNIADQIIINSNITRNKMEYFKISVWLTFIAITQLAVFLFISLFK